MEDFIKEIVAYDQQTRKKVDLEKEALQAYSSELKNEVKELYDQYVQKEEKALQELSKQRQDEYEAYVLKQQKNLQEAMDAYTSLNQHSEVYAQALTKQILVALKEEES